MVENGEQKGPPPTLISQAPDPKETPVHRPDPELNHTLRPLSGGPISIVKHYVLTNHPRGLL